MTPRDLVVLSLVAAFQPVRTDHIRALIQSSTNVARHRVRTLRDLGVIKVHVPRVAGSNWVTLTDKGRRELARALGRDPSDYRTTGGLGNMQLDHHGAAVDLAVALQVACARSRRACLAELVSEVEIRSRLAGAAGSLVPDLEAAVVDPEGRRFALAFEVDRSTENPRWFAERKALQYTALREAGTPLLGAMRWTVAVTVPSVRRLNRLALACWDAGVPEGLLYFAVHSHVTDRNILLPGDDCPWRTPRVSQDDRAHLVTEPPAKLLEGPLLADAKATDQPGFGAHQTMIPGIMVRDHGLTPGDGR